MVMVKFNKDYKDIEIGHVKADTPVEMTLKRADEAVKNVRAQADKFKGYEDFDYERTDLEEVRKEVVKTDKKKTK